MLSNIKAKEILTVVEEGPRTTTPENNVSPSSETSSFRKKQNVPVMETGELVAKKERTYDFGDVDAKKAKDVEIGEVTEKNNPDAPAGEVTTSAEREKTGSVIEAQDKNTVGEVKEAAPVAAPKFNLVTTETTEVKFNLVQHHESLISRAAATPSCLPIAWS